MSASITRTPVEQYRRIRRALLDRDQVVATYAGHRRELCPHALGLRRGERVGYFYQFGGTSSSGLVEPGTPDGWRSMFVDRLEDVTVRSGPWFTAPNYEPPRDFDAFDVDIPAMAPPHAELDRSLRLLEELSVSQVVRPGVEYIDIGGHRWTLSDETCALCSDTDTQTFRSEEVELYVCTKHEQLERVIVTSETRRRAVVDGRVHGHVDRAQSSLLVPTEMHAQTRGELVQRIIAAGSVPGHEED